LLAFSKIFKEINDFVKLPIASIKDTYQEDSQRNFVDHYIKEMKSKQGTKDSSFNVTVNVKTYFLPTTLLYRGIWVI